jgi:hypothetical protein
VTRRCSAGWRLLASASRDGTVRLGPATGTGQAMLTRHDGDVPSAVRMNHRDHRPTGTVSNASSTAVVQTQTTVDQPGDDYPALTTDPDRFGPSQARPSPSF